MICSQRASTFSERILRFQNEQKSKCTEVNEFELEE